MCQYEIEETDSAIFEKAVYLIRNEQSEGNTRVLDNLFHAVDGCA